MFYVVRYRGAVGEPYISSKHRNRTTAENMVRKWTEDGANPSAARLFNPEVEEIVRAFGTDYVRPKIKV